MWTSHVEGVMIDFFAQHRYLGNCKDKDYFKRDLKDSKIQELCVQLGPLYTVAEVKKRWKHLQDSYFRKHKTLQAMRHSGAGADDINRFIHRWEYYTRLIFIMDGYMERESMSNMDMSHSQDISSTAIVPQHMCEDESAHASPVIGRSQPGTSWTSNFQLLPGISNTLPGISNTPPGISNTPPGISNTLPGISNMPPGISTTPPGMSTTLPENSSSSNSVDILSQSRTTPEGCTPP